MAKTATKSTKAPAKSSKSTAVPIAKISQTALEKLKALDIQPQLQADITWCLGSYSHDKNPIGLYEVTSKALEIFKVELSRKTKGVTAKLISDIEKALTTK